MHHIPTARFVTFGVIAAVVFGLVTFITFNALYPVMLSSSDIASLARNGKSVSGESAAFGFLPAFWITSGMLAYVADGYMMRRRSRRASD